MCWQILCLIFISRFLWAGSLASLPLSFLICRAEITVPSLLGCLRIRSGSHVQQAAHGSYSTNATSSSSCPLVLRVPVSSCHPDTVHMAAIHLHKKPNDGGSFRETWREAGVRSYEHVNPSILTDFLWTENTPIIYHIHGTFHFPWRGISVKCEPLESSKPEILCQLSHLLAVWHGEVT